MKKLLLNTFGLLAVFCTILAFSSTASAKSFTITFKTSSNSSGTALPASGQDPIAISVESGTENISKLGDFSKVYAAGLYGLKIGTNSAAGAIGVYFETPVKATKIEVLASASNNPTGQKLDISYKDKFKDPIEFSFNDTELKNVYKTCVLDLDGNTEVAHVFLNKTNSSPSGYISIKSITVTYNEEVGNPDNITPELTWSAKEVTAVLGDESFAAPTLTFGPAENAEDVKTRTKYSSSDPKVATIDNNGKLTLVGGGTTTITAYVEAYEGYNAKEASYTLTVVDPTAVPDQYVLTFGSTGNSKGVQNYTSTWTRTSEGRDWTIENFNNNNSGWTYIRCGSSSAASVAKITTASAMAYPVNEIVLTIDAITVAKVNSIKLLTSTSATDFTAPIHSIDVDKSKGDKTIIIPNPQANLYYSLVFDCQKGTSNGLVQVSKVVYKLKTDNKESAGLEFAELTVNKYSTDAPFINPLTNDNKVAVTYSSSKPEVATVNSETGEVTLVNGGTTTISAAFAGNDTYSAQTVSYTLIVTKGVNSVEETMALENNTKALINYSLTVAFVNGNNVFAVDEAGNFIQVFGENTYKANDIIPAGWTGKYTLFSNTTPEIVPDALPAAVEGGNFIPTAVDWSTVDKDMVNSVVLFKNVVINEPTPATKVNFDVTIAGSPASLRNNYLLPSVEAGVYDVTVVVNIYRDAVSLYVAGYKAVPAFRINGELVTTTTFDANGLKITLEAVLPEGHQMWYRFTPVAAASSQAVIDENGFTKYESAFELEDPGKLEYYSVDPEGNKSEVYELRLDNVTGINDIVVDGDNSEAVYYNLQGVRVDNPNTGIYLVRRAGRVSKVFVK